MAKRISHGARTAVFAPLDQTGRVEAVTRRLVDAITLGLLADEEQLPSEAELAGQFGVSTVTVREALMALRQQGLVETRRGRTGGSFVRAPRDPAAASLRERLRTLTLTDLRDLGDHYIAVAGAAARLAAERSSAEDVERLELATEDLRDAKGAEASRAERHFHLEVAAAAQSPRLTHQEVRLQGELGALLWLATGDAGPHEDAYAEHQAITDAIADADGELARRLTEEHILAAIDRLAELHLGLLAP
ncbi:GntR family transcriptional regulator [Prauserella shujinwangii]|uniref:GntR family transcriptional regulator n=1 Tax=Prauserella shujinwangii TaxID=1453103 RepID=A0A2T0LM35_9PSEU|nr:FCD domain-containing protein [Prauserella shujinwangii]PRX44143.1 GntR family transcriptional regulator [Prauserella shujinwangii]